VLPAAKEGGLRLQSGLWQAVRVLALGYLVFDELDYLAEFLVAQGGRSKQKIRLG
jgi:hypothetical protein